MKVFFNDLSPDIQRAIRNQIKEELLLNRKSFLETQNRSQNEIEDELDAYKFSDEIQEDVDHYIYYNDIGVDYIL